MNTQDKHTNPQNQGTNAMRKSNRGGAVLVFLLAAGIVAATAGAAMAQEPAAVPAAGQDAPANQEREAEIIQQNQARLEEGNALLNQGDFAAAIAVFEDVLRHADTANSPDARWYAAHALFGKGLALEQLEKWADALAAYAEIARRVSVDAEPKARMLFAWLLAMRSSALFNAGHPEAAFPLLDLIDRHFSEDDEPGAREWAVSALMHKGFYLWKQEKPEEALAVHAEIDRRFGRDEAPEVRRHLVTALTLKGTILEEQEKLEAALAAYAEVVRRFGADSAPEVREMVVAAHLSSAMLLMRQGRHAEFEDIFRRYDLEDDIFVLQTFIKSLLDRGAFLEKQGKPEAAIALYEAIDRRYGENAPLRVWAVTALSAKVALLDKQGREKEASAVLETILRRFGADESPVVREEVARTQRLRDETPEPRPDDGEAP
jgi:tetratricopeptide (TPR) repeat protein